MFSVDDKWVISFTVMDSKPKVIIWQVLRRLYMLVIVQIVVGHYIVYRCLKIYMLDISFIAKWLTQPLFSLILIRILN